MSEAVKAAAQETTPAATTTTEQKTEVEQKPVETTAAAAAPTEQTPAKVETEAEQKEPEAEKKPVPESYELKLPEGSLLKAAHLEKIASYAKEQGLSNEAAQAIVERDHQAVSDYVSGLQTQLQERQDAWVQTAMTDKELGGDAFKENAELAKRVISRYGSDALKKELNDTKWGDHPEVLRVFVRIGKAMAEDQLVLPGKEGAGGKSSPAEILYGSKSS